jgi:hypothetical protein
LSCNNLLILSGGRCITNDISDLPSFSRLDGDNFVLTFDFTDTDLIMSIKVKDAGWFGIGFGSSMKNVDMIYATIGSNNEVLLNDAYSSGETFPQLDVSLGGRNDLIILGENLKLLHIIEKNVTY